jgi:ribonuclease P protein component
MVPKKNRATKKDLDSVWSRGATARLPGLTFKYFKSTNSEQPRISFTVPKTVGTAVYRNTIRRRGYAALGLHIPHLPKDLIGVMIYTPKKENEKSLDQINRLVSEILKRFL